ncbi:MAG: RNA methyltransferase [Opitutaceae bacterium]|nr:RNA methyltransferase [Opitutaceae bacterium]
MLSKTRFQSLLAMTRKKERAESGMFFVEGWRWLEEALALPEPPACVLAVAGASRSAAEESLLARARTVAHEFHETSPEQLAKLTETVSAPGVAALVRWRPTPSVNACAGSEGPAPALVVALDAVGDPGNAGTIIRTADWFGAAGVVLGDGSVEPTNPKVVRATMGSLFHLPIAQPGALAPALEALRARGFAAVGAALDGVELPQFRWPARTVLVIGNEANGIQPAVAAALDHRVRIPAHGRAESLNAAIAAAVLMADWRARAMASVR